MFSGSNIGDIRNPFDIRLVSFEVAIQMIGDTDWPGT